MRVRVIRLPDSTSSEVKLVVQRWCAGQWEFVQPFALNESELANEFAMKLSMTKREPMELAVYHDGQKVEGGFEPGVIMPGSYRPAMDSSEEVQEKTP